VVLIKKNSVSTNSSDLNS